MADIPESSWAALMELNREVREATKVVVEFCRQRSTDPRTWTRAQRSRLIRLVERQEDVTGAFTAMVDELLQKPEVFGAGPNPHTRDGHLLGWHLRVDGPNDRATMLTVPRTPSPVNNEDVSDATSTTAEPPCSPPGSP